MILKVRVIPNAKKDEIEESGDKLRIHVQARPVNNKANRAIIALLAKFFNIKNKDIVILKGEKSRDKIIEVDMKDKLL